MITLAPADTLYALAGSANAVTFTVFGMQMSAGSPSWSKLALGQIAASAAQIYASGGGTTTLIAAIVLCNTTNAAVTVKLFSGGSASGNQILNLNAPANGQVVVGQAGIQTVDAAGLSLLNVPTLISPNAPLGTTSTTLGVSSSEAAAARRDHTHWSPGGVGSITTTPQVVGYAPPSSLQVIAAIPPNTLQLGSVWRLCVYGHVMGTGSGGPPGNYLAIGPAVVMGMSECAQFNGSAIGPVDPFITAGLAVGSATNAVCLHMLVAMKSATGSYLTPTIAAFPNSASSTVFSIPAFCAPATSGYIGAGRIDPTVANYIGMISNQSNSVGWGLRSITGVFELVQP